MPEPASPKTKVEKPATYFQSPSDVVSDARLSATQKRKALDTLEQDARQLADASAEGMAGGEPTNLHDVLQAKAEFCGETDAGVPTTLGAELAQTVREQPFWSMGFAMLVGIGIGVAMRR
ncbi:hypothetical protein AAFN86_21405 [Roseomonas sp. CAU 1739]|uniref:hypothetical protein n=1 Tax=Roseomonas sp. CAU 1739 TaxID=3140364 RepID=UPI00325BDD1B